MPPQNTNPIQPTNKTHRIIVLTLTILLTAGVIGGGTYYVLGQQIKKQDKLIEELLKDEAGKADLHELQNALEQYYVDNDGYSAATNWQVDLVTAKYLSAAKIAPTGSYSYATTAKSNYTLTYTLKNTSDTGPNIVSGVYTLTNEQ